MVKGNLLSFPHTTHCICFSIVVFKIMLVEKDRKTFRTGRIHSYQGCFGILEVPLRVPGIFLSQGELAGFGKITST